MTVRRRARPGVRGRRLRAAPARGARARCTAWPTLPHRLPMTRWADRADAGDAALLAHCRGPTLDIGCGPGRLSAAPRRARRHVVLGIDVVPEAVAQTRARGVRRPAPRRLRRAAGRGPLGHACCSPTATSASAATRSRLLRRVARAARARRPGRRRPRAARAPALRTAQRRARVRRAAARTRSRGRSSAPTPIAERRGRGRARASTRVHEHDGRWFAVLARGGRADAAPRPSRARRTSPRRCAAPRSPPGSGSGSASASASRS